MILVLTAEEHRSLLVMQAYNPDAKLLKHVQIVLGVAAGVSPTELVRRLGVGRSMVYRVRDRFAHDGLAGLEDGCTKLRGPRTVILSRKNGPPKSWKSGNT